MGIKGLAEKDMDGIIPKLRELRKRAIEGYFIDIEFLDRIRIAYNICKDIVLYAKVHNRLTAE